MKTKTQTENKAWGKIHSTARAKRDCEKKRFQFSNIFSSLSFSFSFSAFQRSLTYRLFALIVQTFVCFVNTIAISSLCNSSDRQKCANVSIQQEIRIEKNEWNNFFFNIISFFSPFFERIRKHKKLSTEKFGTGSKRNRRLGILRMAVTRRWFQMNYSI